MTRIAVLIAAVLAVHAATVTAAQLYRWVDDKGRVEWRDTPPPATATKVERRNVEGSVIQTTPPYGLQQVAQKYPVILYATDCGEACTRARAHLIRRGVPFTQQNPQNDIDAYMKLTNGSMVVPILYVGTNQIKGYLETSWDSALDSAGYLREPMPGYVAPQAPAVTPLAPTAAAPAAAPQNAAPPPAQ